MLAALLVALAPAREPALAAAASYVALGDSYASGVGTATYYAESGSCRRGPAAYPVLVAARLGASLSFAACSGAKTGDVLEDQIDAIGPATTYVTVTVGGNDAGFGRVLARCALPWPLSCTGRIAAARRFVRSAIPAKLDAVYHAIRDRAPAARVAVVGYPRLFAAEDCDPLTSFSGGEEAGLNRAADLLARVVRREAAAHGFAFVDPRAAFAAHELCAADPWLTGLSIPLVESFHPNASGHADGYAPPVYSALRWSD